MAVLLFAVSFVALDRAVNHQVDDSRYTLLLSQSLLDHGAFALDRYQLGSCPPSLNGVSPIDYRLSCARGHVFYLFPVGSSILSIPYVAVTRLLGGGSLAPADPLHPQGAYDVQREERMQRHLAGLLMAAFCVLAFLLARPLLPPGWSVLVALVMTFGTQVFSTTSRALWSDSWGIVLVGLVVLHLLRRRVRDQAPNGPWLATLGCWAYFVRPTNVLVLVAVAALLARDRCHRGALVRFIGTAALWIAGFVAYALAQFGTALPFYYQGTRLGLIRFLPALAGVLVSPARGLFIYVPVVLFILFLIARHWRQVDVRYRPLAAAALLVCLGHLLTVSSYPHWWGGHSFGARLFAGLVPWFAVLAVLGLDAARAARSPAIDASGAAGTRRGHGLWVLGGLLCAASVAINTAGATWPATFRWNDRPCDIDKDPARLWNWRYPQFLADLTGIPYDFCPIPPEGLAIGSTEAEPFLKQNWSGSEGDFRWTEGTVATLRFFRPSEPVDHIAIVMEPYLPPGLPAQRVTMRLNGNALATFRITERSIRNYVIPLDEDYLRDENILTIEVPDAAAPAAMGGGNDQRRLGVAIRSIQLLPVP